MHRRDLLKYLLMTPAATFIDYEKLLWVPGEKKIFVPSRRQLELFFNLDKFPQGVLYHDYSWDVVAHDYYLGIPRT